MVSPSPKFSVPQSSVQISGSSASTWARRVSGPTRSVLGPNSIGFSPPPISKSPPMPAVRLTMMSTSASRMRSITSRYRATSRLNLPVSGLRTWQYNTVAPAFAASTAAAAICLGVTGTWGLLALVSPAPVSAQVMMTSWFIGEVPYRRVISRRRVPFAVRDDRETERRITLFTGQLQVGGGRFAVEGGHAFEPALLVLRVVLEPLLGGLECVLVIQQRLHHSALVGGGEGQVGQQLVDVGALLGVGRRGDAPHRGHAFVRAQGVFAAGEVGHCHVDVHRVRRPAEEHHGFLAAHRAVDGGEHAGFAGLHQLEFAQAELVLGDHRFDLGVGARAWLDT